jgi:hypothetical protein
MIQMKKLKHFATMISYLPEAALLGKGKHVDLEAVPLGTTFAETSAVSKRCR